MIPVNPTLPDPRSPNYAELLNWKLTQLLRDMAIAINRTQGATWDGPHPILGGNHLWVDATGDLRIKASAPTSDLDGTIVGTQS
jgi:hypothetical protein